MKEMNVRQREAFFAHEVKGMSIPETAELVGADEKTIDRWKASQPWRDLAIKAIQQRGDVLDKFSKKVWDMAEKKKQINVGGELEEVDDNIAQGKFIDTVMDVYGIRAPQKHEVTSGPSDEEIERELEEATGKLPVESVEVGEPGTSSDHTEKGEGTVL